MYSLLVLDDDIKALATVDPYSQRGSTLLKNIKTKMSNQKSTLDMIEEAYVYYPQKDLIISSQGIVDLKSAHSLWHGALEYEQWLSWLHDIGYREYLITERTENFTNEKVITLVGNTGNGSEDLKIVVFLNMAQLEAKLAEYSDINDTAVMLADENNEIILKCGNYADAEEEILPENKDDDFIITSKSSSVKKWQLYTVTEENKYWGAGKAAQRLMWISTLICLLFGGVLASYLLFRNYRPIKKIINIIDNNPKLGLNTNENEYTFIANKINEIISDRDSLSGQVEKSRDVLRSDILLKLINNRFYNIQDINGQLDNAQVYFESDLFAVALINIEDYKRLFEDDAQMSMAQRRELTVLIVTNIAKEMVEKYHQCFALEQNNRLTFVISLMHEDREKALREIADMLKNSIKYIEEYFGIFITASVSDIHEGLFGISECNREAAQVMDISELMGDESVLCYSALESGRDSLNWYNIDDELSMIKLLSKGNSADAIALLDRILGDIVEHKMISSGNINFLAADMGHTFLKVDSELGIIGLKNMINSKTVKDLYVSARECITAICQKITEENKIYKSDLKEKIGRYILENYSDQSLCAQSIASHFGLSGSYLSEKYKSETGESLHHLISKVRVNKAKELMQNSGIKLEKVAEQVGFCDVQALRRAFKRHEGVLPSDYRRK